MPDSPLACLFAPQAVVLVSASGRQGALGKPLARHLARILGHNLVTSGYRGPLWAVHPKARKLGGLPCVPDLGALPGRPDLAIIASPAAKVPALLDQVGALGARAAILISPGFGEGGDATGLARREEILRIARQRGLRLLGPNCLGLMVPGQGPNAGLTNGLNAGLNASLGHRLPSPGRIAFVAQSGTIVATVLDWALTRGIGFSHLVSLGDMVDVDFGDVLDHLAMDGHASAILLFIETLGPARKFLSAARAAARLKPVILVKAGRSEAGAQAVLSHTGALAGADAVQDAAFRRAGLLRVHSLEALFDAVTTLAQTRPPRGDRLVILTNSGGAGVLATDALMAGGGRLAELHPATRTALDQVLPPGWSGTNPIDLLGDADGHRYAQAMEILRTAPGVDAILALHSPSAGISPKACARALIEVASPNKGAAKGAISGANKVSTAGVTLGAALGAALGTSAGTTPGTTLGTTAGPTKGANQGPVWGAPGTPALMASWMGGDSVYEARRLLAASQIPSYDTPERAVGAFLHLVAYGRAQVQLMETPPALPGDCRPDLGAIQPLLQRARSEGREWLTEPEAKAVLTACRIPVIPTHIAGTPEEAARLAEDIGAPVALKLLSPDIPHKRRAGGVALELTGPAAVRAAALAMLERVGLSHPQARLQGFSVQAMARRPEACELILGLSEDPQFGPVLLVGQGGSGAEVLGDRALGLPPLNLRLAMGMLEETRVHARLRGGAGLPRADLEALALALVRLSELAVEVPDIVELDVNPLLVDHQGILALDARIRLRPAPGPLTQVTDVDRQSDTGQGVAGDRGCASLPGVDSLDAAGVRLGGGSGSGSGSGSGGGSGSGSGGGSGSGSVGPGLGETAYTAVNSRLVIRPYPRELEEEIPLPDGRLLWLRPIQAEDEPALQAHYGRLDPEESRMRFFVPRRTLDHITAARFSQLDYDREMALVLTEPGPAGQTPIHGVVSLNAEPGLTRAEFAIVINRAMTGLGLGLLLMHRILDYARSQGLAEVHGEVLRENRPMLKLCQLLGFTAQSIPDEPGLVRVSLALGA